VNAVDHVQNPVELDRAAEIYKPASGLFDLLGAPGKFRLRRAASAEDVLQAYKTHFGL
jgi:hypothetical protein